MKRKSKRATQDMAAIFKIAVGDELLTMDEFLQRGFVISDAAAEALASFLWSVAEKDLQAEAAQKGRAKK